MESNGIVAPIGSHTAVACFCSMLQQLQHQEIKKGVAEEFMSLRSSAKHKARTVPAMVAAVAFAVAVASQI